MAKEIIDTLAIKEIKSILEDDLPEQEMQKALVGDSSGIAVSNIVFSIGNR